MAPTLDANDVVDSFAVQWDAENPLHKGRDGSFTYFSSLFGGLLNPPPPGSGELRLDRTSTKGVADRRAPFANPARPSAVP